MLEHLLREKLLDYVAMDIKNAPSRYAEICGADVIEQVKKSAALLKNSNIDYEFRTTVCHSFHSPKCMEEIGQWLRNAKQYYIQPFVRTDKLTYNEVKHCIESFVYGVNTPSRWGTQAPFTNITLDWTVPADLADQPCIVGGKPMDFTYGDCKAEMDMINRAFIESGTVFHTFLGEKLPDWKVAAALVHKIAENYELPYYTLSPTYSICADHGYLAGEQAVCPHCGRKTEVYSRITGYYRPVQNWNDGKSQEFRDRKTYHIGEIKNEAKPENKTSSVCDADGYILYTTSTCPNCRAVKPLLEKS